MPKDERREQSHAIAKRVRDARSSRSRPRSARRIQVVEVPPGPPVLQTLVAEVYGPDAERRARARADGASDASSSTPGVVDVDWYVESPQPKWRLEVDQEKAAAAGLSRRPRSRRSSRMAGAGAPAGPAARRRGARGRADRPAPAARTARLARRGPRRCASADRSPVAVGELTQRGAGRRRERASTTRTCCR